MSANPQCVNCFQEFTWSPVFKEGEPYCCDGCIMGGPCVCTYSGPPPKLNVRGILASVGYDVDSIAQALTVCVNCFEEFRRQPVLYRGKSYCCEGCTRGGPCTCTYDPAPAPVRVEDKPPGAPSDASNPAPEDESSGCGVLARTNRLWRTAGQATASAATADRKQNRLWDAVAPPSSGATPVEDVSRSLRLTSEKLQQLSAISSRISEKQEDRTDAPAKMDLDAYATDTDSPYDLSVERLLVSATPLPEVADVRRFTSSLESIPSVSYAMLTHYGGNRAAFEVRATSINQVVKDMMGMDTLRILSLRRTPDGLELVLKPKGGEPKRTGAREPATAIGEFIDTMLEDMSPASQPAARVGEEGELHPFKYEMGVDVFFNGRHQVEVGGVKGPVHMHSWRVQAILGGASVEESGAVVGTEEVRDIISAFVLQYNEKLLNKAPPFDEIIPTANNIARVIFEHVKTALRGKDAGLRAIRLWESPTSYVEYGGE